MASEHKAGSDPFNLQRFVQAQDPVMPAVLAELRAGRKRTHWMWFVFPQLKGLGHSQTARFFGLAGLPEAEAYLRHPVLGARLRECTALANAAPAEDAHALFGSPDDLKFHSSATLFALSPDADAVFRGALDRFFGGKEDPGTLRLLHRA